MLKLNIGLTYARQVLSQRTLLVFFFEAPSWLHFPCSLFLYFFCCCSFRTYMHECLTCIMCVCASCTIRRAHWSRSHHAVPAWELSPRPLQEQQVLSTLCPLSSSCVTLSPVTNPQSHSRGSSKVPTRTGSQVGQCMRTRVFSTHVHPCADEL